MSLSPFLHDACICVCDVCMCVCVRWERLDDLALIPQDSLTHPDWPRWLTTASPQQQNSLQDLYRVVADAVGARRLARQAPIANTGEPLTQFIHVQCTCETRRNHQCEAQVNQAEERLSPAS